MAFYAVEGGWGEERADLRAGIVASTIANANRTANAEPFKPTDFMPRFGARGADVGDGEADERPAGPAVPRGLADGAGHDANRPAPRRAEPAPRPAPVADTDDDDDGPDTAGMMAPADIVRGFDRLMRAANARSRARKGAGRAG